MEFALRWKKNGKNKGRSIVERAVVVGGVSLAMVADWVSSLPGVVCREVNVGKEAKGDGRWLEEVFGERPEGEEGQSWRLVSAGHVCPPRAGVFGRHDTYFSLRERGSEG